MTNQPASAITTEVNKRFTGLLEKQRSADRWEAAGAVVDPTLFSWRTRYAIACYEAREGSSTRALRELRFAPAAAAEWATRDPSLRRLRDTNALLLRSMGDRMGSIEVAAARFSESESAKTLRVEGQVSATGITESAEYWGLIEGQLGVGTPDTPPSGWKWVAMDFEAQSADPPPSFTYSKEIDLPTRPSRVLIRFRIQDTEDWAYAGTSEFRLGDPVLTGERDPYLVTADDPPDDAKSQELKVEGSVTVKPAETA